MSDVVDHSKFVDKKDAYEKGEESGQKKERDLWEGVDANKSPHDKDEDASAGDGELYTQAELEALSQDEVNENWDKVSKSMEALGAS